MDGLNQELIGKAMGIVGQLDPAAVKHFVKGATPVLIEALEMSASKKDDALIPYLKLLHGFM